MKPVSLEIEAFGAFLKKQVISFDIFEASRLFLIHGPTGSGKTTLFDAMCYALYGETTGNRKGPSMRSDHASDEVVTSVSFIFQIGLHHYRAQREIKITRGGNLSENQTLCEVIWDDQQNAFVETSAPLTKKREIEDKVIELLGFSAEQFKQIVILPQGKFQELLLSSTDKKEEILTQLFNARMFERITQSLLENAKSYKRQKKELEDRIRHRLESVGEESQEDLQEKIQENQHQIQQAQTELPQQEKDFKAFQDYYQACKHLHDLYQEFEEVQKKLTLHQQRTEEINRKEQQKLQAERAEVLRGSVEEMDRLQGVINKKNKNIQTTNSIIISRQRKLNELTEQIKKLESQNPEIEKKKALKNQLIELQPQFAELDQLLQLIQETEKAYQTSKKLVENQQAQIQKNEHKIEKENQVRLEQNETLLLQKASLEQQIQQYQTWQDLRKKREETVQIYRKQQQKVNKQEQALLAEGQKREEKSQAYDQLDRQWRQSQAASLAQTLVAGRPCPVCGSTTHPQPAAKSETYVSDQQLAQAKQARDQVEQSYEKLRSDFQTQKIELSQVEERGKNLADQLGEIRDLSEEAFQTKFQEIQEQFQKAQSAEKLVAKIKTENQKLKSEIQTSREKISQEQEKQNKLWETIVQSKASRQNIEKRLPENIASESELKAQIEELQEAIEEHQEQLVKGRQEQQNLLMDISNRETEIKQEQREIKTLESDLDDRERKLARDLKQKEFESAQQVRQALLPEEERTALQKTIDDWKTQGTELKTRHQSAEQKINGRAKPQIEELAQTLQAKEKALNDDKNRLTTLKANLESLRKQAQEIQKLDQKWQKLDQEAEGVIQLAELANGQNELNQKFQTYVLSVFLDDVIDYANQRLRILSQDRYQLHRTDEVQHGLRKSGLDLKVFDSYSGKERLVHNLSGGETFFTSLALALGLADVATANAGGIHLDAMFIDEGFGTLDSETLDLAIRTLMNLDGEYRLVGIISHVAELKERIPSGRLEVVKGRNGSTLKIHAN